jgi:hypothetical protein
VCATINTVIEQALILKVIQYASKLLLIWVLQKPTGEDAKKQWTVYRRLSALVSAFSNARKITRLGHCGLIQNEMIVTD